MAGSDPYNKLRAALGKTVNGPTDAWTNPGKDAQVAEATQRNIERLRALSSQNEDTWVNQVGADPDSVVGGLVNLGASAASAATRTAGDIAGAPGRVSLMKHQMTARPEVAEAYGRYKEGNPTEDDWALLNSRTGNNIEASERDGYVPTNPDEIRRAKEAQTNLEAFKEADETRESLGHIERGSDYSEIVDQSARRDLSADLRDAEGAMASLGESWDGIKDGEFKDNLTTFASSLAELAVNGGEAVLTNPQAMLEYTAEQIPDLAVGAISRPALLVNNISYGMEAYQRGVDEYAAENNGELPPKAQQRKMATAAFGMGLLDSVGEFKILDTAGNVRKAVKEGRGRLKAGGRAVGQNIGVEGATEGTQRKLEGVASLDPATGMDIYEDTVVGGGVGGTISTPAAVSEGLQAQGEVKEEERQETNRVERGVDETIAERVQAGDYDSLVQDTELPADRVAVAITTDATREDATQAEQDEGRRALAKMQTRIDRDIEALEAEAGVLPKKTQDELKNTIRSADALIAQARQEGKAQELEELVQLRERTANKLKQGRDVPADQKKSVMAQLDSLRRARDLAQGNRERMASNEASVTAKADRLDTATNTEVDKPSRKQAADDTVNLLMSGTSSLSESDLSRLMEQAGDVLDTDQQSYLRTLSEAQRARNAASDQETVHQDIFSGSKDGSFKGLPEYRANVMAALDAGDMEAARMELEGLEAFSQSHQNKASLAQQANQQAEASRRQVNIWRDYSSDSGWRLSPGRGKKDDAALRKNGGLQIGYGQNYQKVVEAINNEATAIEATVQELDQAVALAGRETPSTTQPEAESFPEGTAWRVTNPEDGDTVTTTDRELVQEFADEGNVIEAIDPSEVVEGVVEPEPIDWAEKDPAKARQTVESLRRNLDYQANLKDRIAKGRDKGRDVADLETQLKEVTENISEQDRIFPGIREMVSSARDDRNSKSPSLLSERDQISNVNKKVRDQLNDMTVPQLRSFAEKQRGKAEGIAAMGDGKGSRLESTVLGEALLADQIADQLEAEGVSNGQSEDPTPREETPAEPEASTETEPAPEDAGTVDEGSDTSDDGTAPVESEPTNTVYPNITFESVNGGMDAETFTSPDTNLVGAYFSLRKSRDNDSSQHPLSTQADFLSTVLTPATAEGQYNVEGLRAFVPDLNNLNPDTGSNRQVQALGLFASLAQQWNQELDKIFTPKDVRFRYKDLVQYLANEDGTLPENVKTAIAGASFTWLQDNLAGPAMNQESDVRAILGLTDNDPLPENAMPDLRFAGTRASNVQQDLGRKAFQALGLRLNNDAPLNHQTQMEVSLGALAMNLLTSQNYIERHEVQSTALGETVEGNKKHLFVRVARDEWSGNFPLPQQSQAIVDASSNTQGVVGKLFSVDQMRQEPSFEPVAFTQKTTKGTSEAIPRKQQAIIKKEQQKPWVMRTDMKELVGALETLVPDQARSLMYRMAGAVNPDTYVMQKSRQASLEGKNQGLQREVDTAIEFMDHPGLVDDPARPFFIPLSVWSNQRVGMNSLINPLESKVHRFMVGKQEWEHRVPLQGNGKGATKDARHKLRQFRLAVLEGLGEPVDKLSNDTVLKRYDKAVKEIQPHVEAVRALMTGEPVTDQALQAMADYAAGKEQMHTFDTLVHLARRQVAELNNQDSFTSTLIREGDGITNGPALATILSGAFPSLQAGLKLVNKMGFFEKGNPVQSAGQWQEDSANNDLYQSLAHRVDEKVRAKEETVNETARSRYQSVFKLIGNFTDNQGGVTKDGRNRVKTPLTAMAFGSSVDKAVRSMGEDVVEVFFEKIEKTLNDPKKTDAEKMASVNHLSHHMNNLLGNTPVEIKTLTQAQNLEFTQQQRQNVISSFTSTVGEQISETLDEQFNSPKGDNGKPDQSKHSFIQHRKLLNDAAKKTFDLFTLARDYEIRQYKQELLDAGELAWTKTKQGKTPLQSLNRKQQKELDERLKGINPLVHTAMSKASNHREAGLHMGKAAMQPMIGDPAYLSDVKFGQPMKTTKTDGTAGSTGSLKAHGLAMGYDDPGVRVFITNVHAFDSAIASDTYTDFPALNVHDAEIVAAYMMQEVAEQMNQATFNNLVDFSLSEEVVKTGYRVYDSFKAKLPEMEAEQAFQQAYKAALDSSLASVETSLTKALKGANIAENRKLALLAQIETVNQYGVEGGGYKLIETDYDRIAERQKTTITDRVAQDRAKTVQENVSSITAEMNASLEAQATPETNTPEAKPVKGKPVVPGDSRLLAILEREPAIKVRTLLSRMSQTPLNKALVRLVSPDMKVRYVTTNTPMEDLPAQDLTGSRGYYSVREDNEELGIISPDFADSLVTEEVLVHETLHSVLYQTVENVQNGKNTNTNAKAFVREMEQLRAQTVKWLNQPENAALKAEYLDNSNALDNVHELIAWGMTNQGFQSDVLANVPMKTKNAGRLSNALRDFVTSIARFLFGKTSAVRDNGVGTLLVNVAGLMDQAKQQRAKAQEVTLQQRTGPQPEDVKQWTSQEIFSALDDGELSPSERDQMAAVLDNIVTKVQGNYGPWSADVDAQTPIDRFTLAKATGELPFSSAAIGQFPLSRQQMFVLEQAEVALQASMASDTMAYKELARTFRDARNNLKPKDFVTGDWATATVDQKNAAQEKYDFLFKLETIPGETRTNHLSRFAALVLVSPEIQQKLNNPVVTETRAGDGIGNRIQGIYETSLEKLGDRMNQTYSQQPTNQRVQALAYRLTDIQAKHKNTMALDGLSMSDQVDAAASKLGEAVKEQVGRVADSDLFSGSNNGFMKALGETGSAIAEDRVTEVLDALEEYRAYVLKQRQGMFSSLLNEMRGSSEKTRPFHKLLRMGGQNERERKHIQDNVKKDILSRFNRELSREDTEALTRTVLRTDMTTLSREYSDEGLARLLDSPQALDRAVKDWERQVENQGTMGNHYVAYSKLLGYFMATGKARGPNMSLNAYNIARGAGTKMTVSEQQAQQAEKAIDTLTSLYALQYTGVSQRQVTNQIFREENRRGNESGVRYLLKLHEQLKEEALDTLFEGDKSQFIKGYTREIYNPYTEIAAQTIAEGKDLEAQGWQKLPKHLVHDSADPDQAEKFLYVRKWGGLQQHVTGSASYTGTRRKGSAVHGGEYLPSYQAVHQENVRTTDGIEAQHLRKMQRVSKLGKHLDPATVNENFMVPVRNTQGESTNFRYMMTEQNKDEILERNNRMEDVLGSMASHMFDKASTETQNTRIIESLKDFYDAEYNRRPEAFIEVGPQSSDAQARETYHLLPPKTKELIHKVWGTDTVKVRHDMVDMVFGYRKLTAESLLDKPEIKNPVVRSILHHLADVIASKYVLGDKARMRIRQGEDVWQSLVKIVKDNWVIKSLSTLMGNISSNVSILLWSGMNPAKVIETHKTAINGLMEYTENQDELMRLEREQKLGLSSNPNQLNQRIVELRDAIDRNPVKSLIDEGLFQTIVEDVDTEQDDYSYKSQILTRVSDATESVPSKLKTTGKWMLMTHDTPLYKLMFKSTQMSDFVARYSLYQHLTTRKRDPMDHDSAVQRIADSFVNYDLPTHRTLQYLNDMGAVYFTKYYLRIQKVLLNLMQENPVRGIGLALMENYFSGLSTVLDSGPRMNNPLDSGALNLPGSMTEILPIKALLSLW